VIAPIFEARCINCHGPTKHKGGLLLDSQEGILKGGDLGPVLVAGKPEASALVQRLGLPLDDDDHMPPKAKPQPGADEIRAIEAWIAAGAPFEGQIAGIEPSGVQAKGAPAVDPKPAGPAPAPPKALEALREHLVHAEALSADSNLLWIDFAATPQLTDAEIKSLLEPLRDQIAQLSLARCAITSELAPVLARMPNLTRLDLRATAVTDAAVDSLKGHARLEELVLAQTHLTDGVTDSLAAMPALKRVHLWHSGVSPEAAKALKERRPALEVDAGDRAGAAVLEAEPEIKLTGEAPALVQSPAPLPGTSLEPINKVCPVSGTPVDPKYAVVYKGRVIGFCCPNCPGQFWADPAKFEAALSTK
jgi:YHS domain-containing protein